MTFVNYGKIERLDVETSVIENIATGHKYAKALDIHYNKGFVYWTDNFYHKIMRYDIHYNTGFVYLTDVDKRIMTYFIAHFPFTQEVPLASGSVNAWFDPRSGQTYDYKIGVCCFAYALAAETSKSKDGFVRNQYNVSGWSQLSTRGVSTKDIILIVLI